MFFIQIILMSLRGLRANLLRTLLATLGVIIGVGAVISAMSILEGTQKDLRERFESLGSETLMVYPQVARTGGRAGGLIQTMTVEDAESLRDPTRCPSIKQTAPEVLGSVLVKRLNSNTEANVVGTSEAYAEMFNYKVQPGQGRFLTKDDVAAEYKVVVLGYEVAQQLFGNAPALDNYVRVGSLGSCRVVGVMEKKGNIGFRSVDKQVYVPVSTAMNRLFGIKRITGIYVTANGADKVEEATGEIKRELRRRHQIRIREGAKDDFEVMSQEEMRRQLSDFTNIMGFVLYSIAGISLVVGGIGIMNIMLVSVTERTREIGVRMAVGARRWDILKQFLIEASVISLLGGGLGVGAGYAFNNLLEKIGQLVQTHTSQAVIVYALAMAILTGVLSGLYPAFKASRLDPVEALRYE